MSPNAAPDVQSAVTRSLLDYFKRCAVPRPIAYCAHRDAVTLYRQRVDEYNSLTPDDPTTADPPTPRVLARLRYLQRWLGEAEQLVREAA